MALTKVEKDKIKENFSLHENDSGSVEFQLALLTERIKQITKHLSEFKKDNAGKRGLLMLVAQRRSLLKYLMAKDVDRYKAIVLRLNLKK